jgi:hypothetical protein
MNLTKTTYSFMLRYICPSSSFNGEFNIWAPEFAHIYSQLMLKIHESSQADFKWIKYIKSIFDEIGLSFIWNDQIHIKKDLLKSIVKQKLFVKLYRYGSLKWIILVFISCWGIFAHLPVSMGNLTFEHLNLLIYILWFI